MQLPIAEFMKRIAFAQTRRIMTAPAKDVHHKTTGAPLIMKGFRSV